MSDERFPICKKCDALNMPHAIYISCKDNKIGWLEWKLEKAENRIEFLEEICGLNK